MFRYSDVSQARLIMLGECLLTPLLWSGLHTSLGSTVEGIEQQAMNQHLVTSALDHPVTPQTLAIQLLCANHWALC